MDLSDFLEHLSCGKTVIGGSELHQFMYKISNEAMKVTAQLNACYHEPEEIRDLFSKLIGKHVDSSFALFPPVYISTPTCAKKSGRNNVCLTGRSS